jgi:hypothetical protein
MANAIAYVKKRVSGRVFLPKLLHISKQKFVSLRHDVPPMKRGKRARQACRGKGGNKQIEVRMNLNFSLLPCTPQWSWSESW